MASFFSGLFGGEALKEQALEALERTYPELLKDCRAHLAALGSGGASVTADDARDWLLEQPEWRLYASKQKNWMGTLFRTGEWEPVGWKKSRHKENHARPLRVWRIKSFV